MAYIEKRPGRNGEQAFRVQIRLKGHRTLSKTFRRLTDAKLWAKQTETAIEQRTYLKTTEATRHTLAELVDRFIEFELPKLPKVARMLRAQLTWWRSEIGHHLLVNVTPAQIAECRDRLAARNSGRTGGKISPATVNRYIAALSIAMSAAVKEWGWIENNPVSNVKKLREPNGRIRYLERDERVKLLDACKASANRHLYPITVLALSTGMRKSELLNLRWPHVDLRRSTVTLHETKNGERRTVPLTGLALELLRERSKVRQLDTDLLFPSDKKPSQPVAIQDPWSKALRQAGISDFRFHDLRHSTASYLAMNGASIREIADVLGHKTLQMVQRYSHLSEQHTANVVGAMTSKIFG